MNPLLPGHWQAYKFTTRGVPTFYEKGKGLLFKIHPDGKVDYSHFWKGSWSSDAIERKVKEEKGETIITEEGKPQYLVQNLTDKEVEFHVIERYGKVLLVFYLRRVP